MIHDEIARIRNIMDVGCTIEHQVQRGISILILGMEQTNCML